MSSRNTVSNYNTYLKSKQSTDQYKNYNFDNNETKKNLDYTRCFNKIVKLISVNTPSSKLQAFNNIKQLQTTDFYRKNGDPDLDCLLQQI